MRTAYLLRSRACKTGTAPPQFKLPRDLAHTGAAWLLALTICKACFAQETGPRADLKLPQIAPPDAAAQDESPVLSWETRAGRSYWIPALEIIGFDVGLNLFDRHFVEPREDYQSNLSTIRRNLTSKWVVDNDPFAVNQFLHPYQGSMYHGLARSAGLSYWESLLYTFAGSAFWEIAGEATPPSKNDQVASGIAGTFLGEPLFRMASLLLESADGTPSAWREIGAAVISPPLGFNRLAFGKRFDAVFPSRHPAYFAQLQLGAALTAHKTDQGRDQPVDTGEGIADFSMEYGLPGKADYVYARPFDYFAFQFTASTANVFENILTRGLLIGTDYPIGKSYRGVWGLYGSYDYISPQTFRVSSTALSLGTTAQWWLSRSIALQSTALAGVGYGAGGTIHGQGERDYHYGATPQALLALRLIFGERASLSVVGRDYYISQVASTEDRGHENITRAEIALTTRVYRRHAITLRYIATHREAHYPDLGKRHQSLGAVSLFYTLLGDTRFGAVDWRE